MRSPARCHAPGRPWRAAGHAEGGAGPEQWHRALGPADGL
ncbi:protein of unknown function [Burkholderia multivorans]